METFLSISQLSSSFLIAGMDSSRGVLLIILLSRLINMNSHYQVSVKTLLPSQTSQKILTEFGTYLCCVNCPSTDSVPPSIFTSSFVSGGGLSSLVDAHCSTPKLLGILINHTISHYSSVFPKAHYSVHSFAAASTLFSKRPSAGIIQLRHHVPCHHFSTRQKKLGVLHCFK